MSINWFQSPLAAEAALIEPLKRALAGREVLRMAVRALLLRRCLTDEELAVLERSGVGLIEVSHAFARLEAEVTGVPLPTGSGDPFKPGGVPKPPERRGTTMLSPVAPERRGTSLLPSLPGESAKTGMLSPEFRRPSVDAPALPRLKPALDPTSKTVLVMLRATARVVKASSRLNVLCNAEFVSQALGRAVARVLADELVPPLGLPDPNAGLRTAVYELLSARCFEEETLGPINALDRKHLAGLLESRQELMLAVVPPMRALMLGRVLRATCTLLRAAPPMSVATINHVLAPLEPPAF